MENSKINQRPQSLGTSHQKWMESVLYEICDRLDAIEAAAGRGPGLKGGEGPAQQPMKASEVALPDWMRPHASTKRTLKLKAAIMGFIPTKEQVIEKADALKPDVKYTKKQGAAIWNCSEAFALGWFFYIGHVRKVSFDTLSKQYTIQNE